MRPNIVFIHRPRDGTNFPTVRREGCINGVNLTRETLKGVNPGANDSSRDPLPLDPLARGTSGAEAGAGRVPSRNSMPRHVAGSSG